MNNFDFQNPVRLVFGKGTIARLPELLPAGRIMVTFGGGSVKHNGVYEQVIQGQKGREYSEFWGIQANPDVSVLRKAAEQAKAEHVDFLLAVGGGSVIDGTKLIAEAATSDLDAWEIVKKGGIRDSLPFGTVLTIPATGSEMDAGGVISNRETQEKYAFGSAYPTFSILDPTVIGSLPHHQIACGLADAFVHVMEQYLTTPDQSPLMDRWAESVLQTLIETASGILNHPDDYQSQCNFMLSATMALNGFIAMGVTQDWATHMIGHELTALCGLTHGASLVIVLPAMMNVLRKQKGAKILQYGERVFGILPGDADEATRISLAIDRTEEFFRSLGLHTRLSEEGIGQDTIDEIVKRFNERGCHFGEAGNVDGTMAGKVLKRCL